MPTLELEAIELLQDFVLVETIVQISWFDKLSAVKLAKLSLHIQTIRELVWILLIYYTWAYTEFTSKLWRQHCFIYSYNRHHVLYKTSHNQQNTQRPWWPHVPVRNLPRYPALSLQLNEPFPHPTSHWIWLYQIIPSFFFWLLPHRRLPVSSKRKWPK